MTAPLQSLLKETSLDDLTGLQHVTILRDTATVEQALRTLATKRILSAPVITVGSGAHEPGVKWPQDKPLDNTAQLLGFIDVRDVLSSFLLELKGVDIQRMKMLQRMRLLEERGQVFATRPIKDLAVFGGDGDFLHTSQSSITLHELVCNGLLHPQDRGTHHGSLPNEAVHRVAIHDQEHKINNIISQTDICRFLYMNKAALGPLAERTAEQLGWAGHPVVSCSPETSAIEAMALLNARRISALAVVDGVGKIIGNFSISEMRTIMAEHFGALSLPVGEFLALEHGTEFVGYTRIQEEEVITTPGHRFVTDRVARTRPRTPGEEVGQTLVVAPPAATFLQVLELIVCHRVHRVYIMDQGEKPVGVVTCTDVLKVVTKEAERQSAAGDAV